METPCLWEMMFLRQVETWELKLILWDFKTRINYWMLESGYWEAVVSVCQCKSEVKWSESRSVVSDSLRPRGLHSSWNSPGQNTGVGSLSFLHGIFPIQGSIPGLLHCRQILYQLTYEGSSQYKRLAFNPWGQEGFLEKEMVTYCSILV